MNFQNYQDLKKELELIKTSHIEKQLDPVWILVKAFNIHWREAKKMGMKKDSIYGWVFYTTSTNSNGYDLYEKIAKACSGFNLRVIERQL